MLSVRLLMRYLCLVWSTGDRIPLHCMDRHPTQPHIVATGGFDGTLCLWDMRQEKYPITLLQVHTSSSKNKCFHFVTCLANGYIRFSREILLLSYYSCLICTLRNPGVWISSPESPLWPVTRNFLFGQESTKLYNIDMQASAGVDGKLKNMYALVAWAVECQL